MSTPIEGVDAAQHERREHAGDARQRDADAERDGRDAMTSMPVASASSRWTITARVSVPSRVR